MRRSWIPILLVISVVLAAASGVVVNLATDQPPAYLAWVQGHAWPVLGALTVVAVLVTLGNHHASRIAAGERDDMKATRQQPVGAGLPPDIDVFVGRRNELAAIHEVARRSTVITIAGKPGVGKSSIALHAAYALSHRYPHGQIYLDLQGMSGSPLAPATALAYLLKALDEDAEIGDPAVMAGRYRAMVSGRSILILLDDAASEEQVRDLLPGGNSCLVVITSRRPLGALAAAHPPLLLETFDQNESLELLGSLVGAARLEAEPAAACTLVEQCGNLPLAVRIIGARLRGRSDWRLANLATRLANERRRLTELKTGDVEVRACIALSYVELGPTDAATFRRLGSLPNRDFDAEVVVAASGNPLELAHSSLNVLIESQLVDVKTVERYHFHDLIKLFAYERFAEEESSTEKAKTLERVVESYATRVQTAADVLQVEGSPVDQPALGSSSPQTASPATSAAAVWLETERQNLVVIGHAAAALPPARSLPLLMSMLPSLLISSGNAAEIRPLTEIAAKAAKQLGSEVDFIKAEMYAARIDRLLGSSRSAAAALARCAINGEALGEYLLAAQALRVLCHVEREDGHTDAAAVSAMRAAEMFNAGREGSAAAGMLLELAVILKDKRRLLEAADLMKYAIRERSKFNTGAAGDIRALSWAHENYGAILKRLGKFEEATAEHRTSVTMFRSIGLLQGEAYGLRNLGELASIQGRNEQAITFFDESLTRFKRVGDARGSAQAIASMARTAAQQGNWSALARLSMRWLFIPISIRHKMTLARQIRNRHQDMLGRGHNQTEAAQLPVTVQQFLDSIAEQPDVPRKPPLNN